MLKLKLAASALLIATLLVGPAPAALAQNSKDAPIVVGEGEGRYEDAAAPTMVGAFDRAIGELDAMPWPPSPEEVKAASFRRRFLELRLLMDVNAFAYDRDKIKEYREEVDAVYEGIGQYQDLSVIKKELKIELDPDLVNGRLAEMNNALGPIRDGRTRSEMRSFLARPLREMRTGNGLRAPGIWDFAGVTATPSYDAVGNAALLQTQTLRSLQSTDLGVMDVFDTDQVLYFHWVRRQVRNIVILSAMYPDTKAATADVIKPLDELVDDYGDVVDAFNAYVFALRSGIDLDAPRAELIREFGNAQAQKDDVLNSGALDVVASRLGAVRDAHRR